MKKALVSTYCTPLSYGSILQAYALKETLIKLECDSFIITERDKKDVLKPADWLRIRTLSRQLYNLIKTKQIELSKGKNRQFIKEELSVDYYTSYESIKCREFDVDVFISGSDQVFHPVLCRPAFFLDFAPKSAKCISYAASMGITEIMPDKEILFRKLIENFDLLSVREKENADVIKKYTDKEIQVNVDPTFLLSAEEWRRIEVAYSIKGKYILVYPLYWDPFLNSQLKELHERTGHTIVTVQYTRCSVYSNKRLFDVGVREFLWLIDNAEAVITSSFHGVALSTILNKNYSAIINPLAPSRISSLLEYLEITPLSIGELCEGNINYSTVNKNIQKEKEKSITYLKGALNEE